MAMIVTSSGIQQGGVYVGKDTLKTLQGLVGGYIEYIPNSVSINDEDYVGFVCNEEGKLQGLPINTTATNFWIDASDELVGTVVFLKKGELK